MPPKPKPKPKPKPSAAADPAEATEPDQKRFEFRCSIAGYELIEQAAQLGEETVAAYARRVLLARAKEDLKRSGIVPEGTRKKPGRKPVE